MPGEKWDLGHVDGTNRQFESGPEHERCNRATRGRPQWKRRSWERQEVEREPERDGIPSGDERWRVPWLEPLLKVPGDATWPRLMTVPHPNAVGSLGDEFAAFAEGREGQPLRWWQRLVATRLLEVDGAGALVWRDLIMTVARQCGKSWLLRELCLWRIQQGERFGERQVLVHTGKDLQVCQVVMDDARPWARGFPDLFRVYESNGKESILFLPDRSRWVLRAKDSAYGGSFSVAAVDEAWKVRPTTLDESVVPTIAERVQPQMWLISTAHRLATALMLNRRLAALDALETGAADLLVEWSAAADSELDDVEGWRQASPHWTPQREWLVGKQLTAARAGAIEDPDEPDPEQSFRTQWLNQWPRKLTKADLKAEPLLPDGLWDDLAEAVVTDAPVVVALEDNFGKGAAVGVAAPVDDGRFDVGGWLCPDWPSAIQSVQLLAISREIREVYIGASLENAMPRDWSLPPAQLVGQAEARTGLAVFRDLAANGLLVHDSTKELDEAIVSAMVRETTSGLQVEAPRHLVNAVVWAVQAAHKPARLYAVR